MPIRDPSLTPESIRAAMAIPSTATMRGLKDGVGFATTREAMAAVIAASAWGPAPTPLGPDPEGPVVGVICPHDDFLYAGRLYRKALEHITAKTVIVIGVFHGYRKFEPPQARIDTYDTWWTPDGPIRVSALRNRIAASFLAEDAAHDLEHSIEPIVAWLRHERPDREIVPVLAPALAYDFMCLHAALLAMPIHDWMEAENLLWGQDVQVVISADAIHYGEDFHELRFGPGNPASYARAVDEDRRIIGEILRLGRKDTPPTFEFMETILDDPWRPDAYRWTWCGRYSIPFGIELMAYVSGGHAALKGWPLAYETSISAPPLDVQMPPLGFTAPASYDHFVGYPAVAFTFASPDEG